MSLRGRHVTASVAPTCRLLIVTAGGVCLALHADDVKGLLTVDEAGPLETVMVQELSYPHMDVAARLGLARVRQALKTRVILLGKGLRRTNIHVAQVHGLKEFEQSQVLPLPRQFRGDERELVSRPRLIRGTGGVGVEPGVDHGSTEQQPGPSDWRAAQEHASGLGRRAGVSMLRSSAGKQQHTSHHACRC